MWETIWEVVKELCGGGYAKIAGFLRVAWGKLLDCIPAVARKKGEADIIKAKTAVEVKKTEARGIIEVDDMLRRHGLLAEWQEGNINSIIRKADGMKLPGDKQNFRNIDKDWIADYLDKCKNYSDEEMQSLWAKILAGEADKPGSFSKRTVDIVNALSKEDALLFSDFCQFVWNVGGEHIPFIYDWNHKIYDIRQYCMYDVIQKLVDCRLISTPGGDTQYMHVLITEGFSGYGKNFTVPECHCAYFDASVLVNIPDAVVVQGQNVMSLGEVKFTEAGMQLYRICEVQKNDAFFQYTVKQWMELGYNPHSVWPKVDEKGRE